MVLIFFLFIFPGLIDDDLDRYEESEDLQPFQFRRIRIRGWKFRCPAICTFATHLWLRVNSLSIWFANVQRKIVAVEKSNLVFI